MFNNADGRLVGVAQTGATRITLLPDVPTPGELKAPAGFPETTAKRIAAAIRTAFGTEPAAGGGLDRLGSEVLGTDPDELRALQDSEAARWNAVIARLGLRITE